MTSAMFEETTPLQQLYKRESNSPDQLYLRQSVNGEWVDYSWKEFGQQARKIASYLKQQDYKDGDRVAIHAKNCAEWLMVDMGIMLAGLVSVPLYPGQPESSMRYCMEHSETKAIFMGATDNPEALDGSIPEGVRRIGIWGNGLAADDTTAKIFEDCEPLAENPEFGLDKLFTIMYTSGTTGNPKGVMHAYASVAFTVPRMMAEEKYGTEDRFFSYLPLSHAAERIIVSMVSIYSGAVVHFGEGLETFVRDLNRVKPTIFFSVPRLWKKFKEGVDSKMSPAKQKILFNIPILGGILKRKVIAGLGLDQARKCITGSAPTPVDLQEWYVNLGLPLMDGYGMTENFIYGCICRDKPIPGSVGKPYSDNEVKIGEGNEILFKSGALMAGYYLEPEKTAEVLRDGYYHTGDTGYLDDNGNLYVTGRLSEVFKTSKGKFVKPTTLETRFGNTKVFGQMCIIGHGMDQPILLAGLAEGVDGSDRTALEATIAEELAAINAELPPHECINNVFIVAEEWTIENELLTPTMKMKRNDIDAEYRKWVEATLAATDTKQVSWQEG
ncbi:AMP-binding protein [uncultured Pseudoteredinibacter sp.]|uniref:AMP-binding protein n=1 Tax=uncultured Pseudoteredinibacter sp. TaxID=1641701 RepID=UPI002636995F|nr:AMP-binding protein [uncultured Pseudoteredinibacter sp.]